MLFRFPCHKVGDLSTPTLPKVLRERPSRKVKRSGCHPLSRLVTGNFHDIEYPNNLKNRNERPSGQCSAISPVEVQGPNQDFYWRRNPHFKTGNCIVVEFPLSGLHMREEIPISHRNPHPHCGVFTVRLPLEAQGQKPHQLPQDLPQAPRCCEPSQTSAAAAAAARDQVPPAAPGGPAPAAPTGREASLADR